MEERRHLSASFGGLPRTLTNIFYQSIRFIEVTALTMCWIKEVVDHAVRSLKFPFLQTGPFLRLKHKQSIFCCPFLSSVFRASNCFFPRITSRPHTCYIYHLGCLFLTSHHIMLCSASPAYKAKIPRREISTAWRQHGQATTRPPSKPIAEPPL